PDHRLALTGTCDERVRVDALEVKRTAEAFMVSACVSNVRLRDGVLGDRICNRSGCQNLTLAIKASPVVPSSYGHASRITSRDLGPDTTRSPSLYWDACSTCGSFGGHGAGVAGAAPPNLTKFLTPSFERSATASTSTSPS